MTKTSMSFIKTFVSLKHYQVVLSLLGGKCRKARTTEWINSLAENNPSSTQRWGPNESSVMEQLTKISKKLVLITLLIIVSTTYCHLLTEVIAIEMTLGIPLRCGWKKICFYSDSKVAIDYINDNHQVMPCKIYAPLMKFREVIGVFESTFFSTINWYRNQHMHNLAKKSLIRGWNFFVFILMRQLLYLSLNKIVVFADKNKISFLSFSKPSTGIVIFQYIEKGD